MRLRTTVREKLDADFPLAQPPIFFCVVVMRAFFQDHVQEQAIPRRIGERGLSQACRAHVPRPIVVIVLVAVACAPRVELPPAPLAPGAAMQGNDRSTRLAVALAPILYVQRDEPFALDRVAAVVHPIRPMVAYHLLWRHDINGQWLPWAKPSDEEIVWVGYDPVSRTPKELWTYWHGSVLHTAIRPDDRAAIDVQWGKHGSLPHNVIEEDLPRTRTLNVFYALSFLLVPDMLLGRASHGGPVGFFHSYARYRDFSIVMDTRERLSAVIEADDPSELLKGVFTSRYAHKIAWPPE